MNGEGVDFHNHLIPGVDDGAQDPEQALAALRAMAGEGVGAILATPHANASLTERPALLAERLADLDAGWQELRRVAAGVPGLRLERGVELMLDVPEPDLSDPRLRLAGTSFVLVEFPYFSLPPRSADVLEKLRDRGWIPVIAHPERYVGLGQQAGLIPRWREAGAYLQVNTGSIIGRFGRPVQQVAHSLLERGWADYLSSDYHARGTPGIRECRDALLRLGATSQARLLLETNPARLLDGQTPLPVPPISSRPSFWRRLVGAFR